ncbi:diguanylate cyclase (GGDEF) domain-containing protein [Pseudomonas flavescens]|uniref:diguanylate cyclase n=1 Tax=Phytopseudomonas flavescens TaxID=29435 RepID=A0A1G8F0Y0_9GAMM|nr:GGDEF domain-containing protein [Pseudomonas flavescens]SDH75737.1 diguanylate cyclase (GGDEF) domain-containing protein [Pseudomonas flavescens]
MIPSNRRLTHRTLQNLLIKRFGMAVATYLMIAALAGIAYCHDLFSASGSRVAGLLGVAAASQLLFFALFISGRNLALRDPSLTEAQVLVALGLITAMVAMLGEGRGSLLLIYPMALLFGLFQLPPRVFFRCAGLAFLGFLVINLYEAYQMRMRDPGLATLQVCALGMVLFWLSLFASYMQSMRQRMRQRRFALQAHQETLRGMMRQLEDLVATDELTGLCNRRHFLRLAASELEGLKPKRWHGLALIDLDHFKNINDRHGHAAGDRVLQAFAEIATACLRDGDIIARYGGEEFVLLVPDTDADAFLSCCERLRVAFSEAEPIGAKVQNLSLSVGMTLVSMHDDLDEALHRADQALYQAKRTGRNRCASTWEAADA